MIQAIMIQVRVQLLICFEKSFMAVIIWGGSTFRKTPSSGTSSNWIPLGTVARDDPEVGISMFRAVKLRLIRLISNEEFVLKSFPYLYGL